MFQLDLKSRKSLYEQVVDGCKEMVIRGELKPGDRLPSIRDMSAALTVNPNTVQKAYSRLESEGWIYTVSGRGAFVSEGSHEPDTVRQEAVYEKMEVLMEELFYLGVKGEDMVSRLKRIIQERRGEI